MHTKIVRVAKLNESALGDSGTPLPEGGRKIASRKNVNDGQFCAGLKARVAMTNRAGGSVELTDGEKGR
jgi:hypothetical protein